MRHLAARCSKHFHAAPKSRRRKRPPVPSFGENDPCFVHRRKRTASSKTAAAATTAVTYREVDDIAKL